MTYPHPNNGTRNAWQNASLKLKQMDKDDRLKAKVSDFFTDTSFTALVRIYKATSVLKRLMWSCVVLAMVSWMVIQCLWLFQKFFKYPVEVKIELRSASYLEFPSVTICNLNPILESVLTEPKYQELAKYKTVDTEDSLYQETQKNWQFNEICPENHFKCSNGQCANSFHVCDGFEDCINGNDEENCEEWQCVQDYFKCNSTSLRCFPPSFMCDNYPDCPDEMDEPSTCPYKNANWSRTTPKAGGTYHTTPAHNAQMPTPNLAGGESDTPNSSQPGDNNEQENLRKKRRASYSTDTVRRHIRDTDTQEYLSFIQQWRAKQTPDVTRQDSEKELVEFVKDLLEPELAMAENKGVKEDVETIESAFKPRSRQKRSKTEPEKEKKEIDWDALMKSSSFNKWEQLSKLSENFYTERDAEYEATVKYAILTALMDPEEVEYSGHLKNDLIASCMFGGYKCSPQNFTYFHNYKYGNCYTFNSMTNQANLSTKFAGPSHGLILELFINSEEYVPNLSPSSGIRVLIHKKGTTPFPEDEGFSIMPQRSINIGMRQVSMDRLRPPHGRCSEGSHRYNPYQSKLGYTYTKLSCLKSCYQSIVIRICHCQTPLFHVEASRGKICNLTDPFVDHCVTNLPLVAPEDYEECDRDCPVPCKETDYLTSLSMAVWPSMKYKEFFQKKMERTNAKYINSDPSLVDFTRLQIYFSDLMMESIEQQKGYESMNLISDLGGQLGLWLGLSAITIGELCSFLFSLGRSLPSSWCGDDKKKVSSKVAEEPGHLNPATLEEMYKEMALSDTSPPPPPPAVTTNNVKPPKKMETRLA